MCCHWITLKKKKATNKRAIRKRLLKWAIYRGRVLQDSPFQRVLLWASTSRSASPGCQPWRGSDSACKGSHTRGAALSVASAGRQKPFHAEVSAWTCLCVCSTGGSLCPSERSCQSGGPSPGAVGETRELSLGMQLRGTFRTSQNNNIYRELQKS